jgi:uncharacterized protein (TIGR02270 family)
MTAPSARPIAGVVQQHVDESAILRNTRTVLVRAPHIRLHHLQRLDDRIAAHLDGLAIAGEAGWKLCEAALVSPARGELFTSAVRAIEDRNASGLDKLFALAEAMPESQRGLISAFGWAEAKSLHGIVQDLLGSHSVFERQAGLAACALHSTDPGAALDKALTDSDAPLRARALRVAGVCGRRDLLGVCLDALSDDEPACRFQAACAATLLGDRRGAVAVLQEFVLKKEGPHRLDALQLLLKALDPAQSHAFLKMLAPDVSNTRLLIQGAGIAGDPQYVPWLIAHMKDLKLTRVAAEAFSFITGLDLSYLDLDRKPPRDFEPGPSDDPNDTDVSMDEDESLPWPDAVKIEAWWNTAKSRFRDGTRNFCGEPVSRAHCVQVLKEGYQRQRIAAAQYLPLLEAGMPLFNTAAPARRQRTLLEKLR